MARHASELARLPDESRPLATRLVNLRFNSRVKPLVAIGSAPGSGIRRSFLSIVRVDELRVDDLALSGASAFRRASMCCLLSFPMCRVGEGTRRLR